MMQMRFGLTLVFGLLVGCHTWSPNIQPSSGNNAALNKNKQKNGKAKVRVGVNSAPVITKVWTREGTIRPGQVVLIQVQANDPDNDRLYYRWRDNCGGRFYGGLSALTFWHAPQTIPTSQTCSITVEVYDRQGGTNTGTLTVNIGGPFQANTAPKITTTFQSSKKVNRDQLVILHVAAIDPEGLPLQFTWQTGGGTLHSPTTTANQSEVGWRAPTSGCEFVAIARINDPTGLTTKQRFKIKINCP